MRVDEIGGVGLGLRRGMLAELCQSIPASVNFLEVAPENWIGIGGKLGKQMRAITEQRPLVCHGLSLSLGASAAELDKDFLSAARTFVETHNVRCYSEHLSYCSDEGQLYDLLPIPFTPEAVKHTAARIRQAQDIVGRRIAVENVSYYASPGQEMSELEFLCAVIEEADCELLLDVNNIYVNAVNHQYDAKDFLFALPAERIAYCHIAGHYNEAQDLIVDTHGADVIDPVWDLLELAYEKFGVIPTLLERDFNIPAMDELLGEINQIHRYQEAAQ